MSLITVNGFGVLRGCLTLPRVGAWHAEFDVDADKTIEGQVEIEATGAGGLELRGTVSSGRLVGGINRLRIVAGADGLRKTAKPKHYVRPTVRVALADLLTTAGEKLSGTSAAAVLGAQLPHWTTIGVSIGEQIAALVSRACPAGTSWRMLPDGTLFIGPETWSRSTLATWVLLEENPRERRLELAIDGAVLLPGTSLGEWKIDSVVHTIDDDGRHTTHAWEAA